MKPNIGVLPTHPPLHQPLTNTPLPPLSQAKPEAKFNDLPFAFLFVGHFVLIAWMAISKGIPEINGSASGDKADFEYTTSGGGSSAQYGKEMIGGMCFATAVGVVMSFAYVKVCISLGAQLIHASTKFFIALLAVLLVIQFAVGNTLGAIICFVILAINICWYRAVYDRIAFAGANLGVACTALRNYPTLFAAAFAAVVLNFVWIVFWVMAMLGVLQPSAVSLVDTSQGTFDARLCTSYAFDAYLEDGTANPNALCTDESGCCKCTGGGSPELSEISGMCPSVGMNSGVYFLMLISLYWGSTVVSNVIHCTTAGAVATWWFKSDSGATPVWDSFFRSMTFSFGSICLGSLLVAILKATRQMLREAQKNKNAQVFLCIIQCLLGIIESLLEIFNRYAFCYVAIYGYDFKTAGKSVFAMFKKLGWTTIINDDLVETALNFGCLAVGMVSGLCCYAYGSAVGLEGNYMVTMAVVGIFIGFFMAQVVLNVVSSAVATVFVCWAENPEALFQTHNELANGLVSAWREFHGDVFQASGSRYNQGNV
jgi:hypothetical protein